MTEDGTQDATDGSESDHTGTDRRGPFHGLVERVAFVLLDKSVQKSVDCLRVPRNQKRRNRLSEDVLGLLIGGV